MPLIAKTELSKVAQNLERYRDDVKMPGGYNWNHPRTLRTVELYYNGEFKDGRYDSQGYYKFFYNIIKTPVRIAQKFTDIDTKDISLIGERGVDDPLLTVMQQDLKLWLKDNHFDRLFNEIAARYAKYGHVVIKKSKNGWVNVNIHNMRTDPSIDWLENADFVYEVHRMTRREIMDMPWEGKVDLPNAVKEFEVYEMYDHSVDGGWDRKFMAIIREDDTPIESTENLGVDEEEDVGMLLHADHVDELPYREIKWEEIVGRWLGLGFVEELIDNQVRSNTTENLKSKSMHFKALSLFFTRDDNIDSNVLTDFETGDIIKTTDQLVPVANEDRNLGSFVQAEQRWDQNTQELTFTSALARGEEIAADKPLGVANLELQQIASFYEGKREKMGIWWRDIFLTDIIPNFRSWANKAHKVTFTRTDKDIDMLAKAVADARLNTEIRKYIERTGFGPDAIQIEDFKLKLEDQLQSQRNMYFEVPESAYQDVKFKFDIITTDEQLDRGRLLGVIATAMQALINNPQVLQNPQTRPVFLKFLEWSGMPLKEIAALDEQVAAAPDAPSLEQGGSVAAPVTPQTT